MTVLSVEEIIYLHELIVKRYGGSEGIRDKCLLESAVCSVSAAYDDTELYPTVEDKAARLCFELISNHPFVDGNKRIGVLAMLVTLEMNNASVKTTSGELFRLGLGTAEGKLAHGDILWWVWRHRTV